MESVLYHSWPLKHHQVKTCYIWRIVQTFAYCKSGYFCGGLISQIQDVNNTRVCNFCVYILIVNLIYIQQNIMCGEYLSNQMTVAKISLTCKFPCFCCFFVFLKLLFFCCYCPIHIYTMETVRMGPFHVNKTTKTSGLLCFRKTIGHDFKQKFIFRKVTCSEKLPGKDISLLATEQEPTMGALMCHNRTQWNQIATKRHGTCIFLWILPKDQGLLDFHSQWNKFSINLCL